MAENSPRPGVKSYTQQLAEYACSNWCPGCKITLESLGEDLPDYFNRFCRCCGWYVWGNPQQPDTLQFGSFPLVIGEDGQKVEFQCSLLHPEHRANWPKPQRDIDQPDEYTEEELRQEIVDDNPRHYYILTYDRHCPLCGEWAPHKIVEEINVYNVSNYTSSLCCDCFEKVFGLDSHKGYDKVYNQPKIGEAK